MDTVLSKVSELAESLAGEYGLQVVDVLLLGSSKKPLLRVFIDKERGVTLGDCEEFSRALSAVLDIEDPIQTSYVLEVSSPGLDRPLTSRKDFEKNIGKRITVRTKERINNKKSFTGTLQGLDGDDIVLVMDKHGKMNISLVNISKAKLAIEIK
ncbi:MAG: ribosome maturation factor RimP [Nitrospiraceae bacterium]|nr:MAG: ribosome maturation factor RimP [Nitrospiraceae bacterium]